MTHIPTCISSNNGVEILQLGTGRQVLTPFLYVSTTVKVTLAISPPWTVVLYAARWGHGSKFQGARSLQ
jgi:hypothetical protein